MNTSISAGSELAVWYVLYASRLRRAARRIVGNAHDAEDATQDAFLAAFRAYDRYRPGTDPYPWLHRIATRKALTIAAGKPSPVSGVDQDYFGSSVPSAEDEAVAQDEARRVQRLVAAEIPVALHLIDGLRFRDVSERLGIPPATAATRIRRGKRRLRLLLGATTFNDQRSKTA